MAKEVDRPKISLIIGANVPEAFIPLEVCHGNPEHPIAIRSCLGFAVLGRTGDIPKRHHIHAAAVDIGTLVPMNTTSQCRWKTGVGKG